MSLDACRTLCRSRLEAIGREVVRSQILIVVIRRDIVDVNLIALLDVVKEEVRVGHGEDQLLHAVAELGGNVRILNMIEFCYQ